MKLNPLYLTSSSSLLLKFGHRQLVTLSIPHLTRNADQMKIYNMHNMANFVNYGNRYIKSSLLIDCGEDDEHSDIGVI